MNLLALQRRDLALEPNETALGAEPLAQLGGIGIGHDRGEQLGRLVDVDDSVRLPEQRGHAHVGCQDFAVAVEDVRPRGRNRVVPDGAAAALTFGQRREHDEPGGDDRIADGEHQHDQPDARARLDGAVDIAAIE